MANPDIYKFPQGFMIGSASSAYQIEGAWNEDGKGENIWDRHVHTHPDYICDGSSGDVACDSYHKYKEDVKALKDMRMNFYRFSISWSRVLPKGDVTVINEPGIQYYHNLITELLDNGIEPVVTMYHWDLPQPLQELGGWVNPIMADYFEDYAEVLYRRLGEKVKWWITFNEPAHVCRGYSHEVMYAPGLSFPGVGDYQAAHTILKSHARAFHLYKNSFQKTQHGKISIALASHWFEPETNSAADGEASRIALQFELGWFAHPIFSAEGDYPEEMKSRIAVKSKEEGRRRSRLPEFSKEWIQRIRGTADFFAYNHYTSSLVTLEAAGSDSGVKSFPDPNWTFGKCSWLKVVPWGLRKMLVWIRTEYNNPPVFIAENGFGDSGELQDNGRVTYLVNYLAEALKAVNVHSCNVIAYTAWSLLDNYEWLSGYTEKFGLYHVDFSDPKRHRTPKKSARVMAGIIKTKKIPLEYLDANLLEPGLQSGEQTSVLLVNT